MDLSDAIVARFLSAFDTGREAVFFVQVGSNDGAHNDPLRPFVLDRGWQGVMVEPVPYVFERLRLNYGDRSGVTLVNAAVTNYNGFTRFHCLDETSDPLPEWYDQLGSLTLEPMLDTWIEQVIPDIRERIVAITVPCLTFDSLCRGCGVDRIDLLHIDAEGHDFEIIKTVDFLDRQPTVVIYEHKHLGPEDRDACRRLLAAHGYQMVELAHDTLCVSEAAVASPQDVLGRAWRNAVAAVVGGDSTTG